MTTIQIHPSGACVAWEVIVEWAKRNNVWDSTRRVAASDLSAEYEGSGCGISSSDMNHRTVSMIVQEWGPLIANHHDLLDVVDFIDEGDPENPRIRTGYVSGKSNAKYGYIAVTVSSPEGYPNIMAVAPQNIINERDEK